MGLEPTTSRSTIWCSAIELQAPYWVVTPPGAWQDAHWQLQVNCARGCAGGQGFEPRLTDPKSVVLPLDDPPLHCQSFDRHVCAGEGLAGDPGFVCRDPDLNWGHQHFQCCALPTELSRRVLCAYAGCAGVRTKKDPPGVPVLRERAMRFELTTFSLARRRSTTELRPHNSL